MKSIAKVSAALFVCVIGMLFISLHAAVPSVPSNTWFAVGDMSQSRAGAAGALLPNGYVLVAGGLSGTAIVATTERYSPNGGGFLQTPPMEMPRANHTATSLADGRVLATGGTGTDGVALSSAEIYDPSANGWTPAAPLNMARRGHTATLLPDATVLIAGGDDGGTAIDTLEIFDPQTGTFAYVDAHLSGARTLHAAAALADGRVLIVGGFDGTSPLHSTNIYDPATGVVTAGPDLSTARWGASATTLLDGKVLVAGGVGTAGELASAQLYDPATNAFGPTTNSLTAPRQNHLAFLLPHNNQVLIVGGTAGGNPVAAAEVYTPWEGTGGTFCASAVCASGYVGPAAPLVARAWATGSALSFPASATNRSGPGDGLLLLAGGTGEKSAELYGFATIKTDKDDYAPGTTVTITGSGWQPNEWVALQLMEWPQFDEHPLLDVQADGNGNIVSTEFVPDAHDVGILFYLTAYGTSSQAQTTFTDDENLTSVGIGSQSPSGVVAGAQATYVVSVTFTKVGSNDTCIADLTVTGLTSGASGSFSPTSLTQTNGTATLTSTLTVTTTGSILTGTTSFTATATGRAGSSTGCAGVVRNSSGSLTVVPATTVAVSPASGVYGGSTGAITSTLAKTSDSTPVSGKTIVFTLNGGTVGTAVTNAAGVATLASGSLVSPAKINAGTFGSGVRASFGGDTSFGSSNATSSLTVSQRAITVTAATNTKQYDATTGAAAVGTITAGALVTGDTAPTWTETYDTKHVGPGKTLTAAGTVTDGNGGGNYAVTFAANTTGAITARPLTVTGTNSLVKAYDGTAGSTTAPSITSGVLQGTDTAAFTQSYDTKHVGSGKTVTPAGTVADGNSGLNYTYTFVTRTNGGITARPITVTAATNSKGYDGTTSAAATPTITVGTLATGDTSSFTEAYANKNVGTNKVLTPGGLVADGNSGNDYAVAFVNNTTGQITARVITVTAATNSKGYDGTTSAAAAPAITNGTFASGDTGAFTETYDNKNVGTNKVMTAAGSVTDGNGGNNYAVTFATNTTGQITARAITVTAATNNKSYDGTTSAAATPTMTTGTLASGDTAVFTETYDNKNAGTGKTLTAAGTVSDGNGGVNYLVTFTSDTTGMITAQPLTVTATNNLMKQYDGTTGSTTAPSITSGALQGTDTAAFTQSYDTKHVGNGKTVTPAGTVADGNGGLNYTYTFVTRTNCGITTRPITVTAATNSKGYDGTTSAAAAPTITVGTFAVGDTASFTETYSNKNVGTGKTLTATGTVADGNSGNDYAVTFVNNGTGVITAQALTVTATVNTKAYDGTASAAATPAVTSGTIQAGDTGNFSETYDTKHVGTAKTLTPAGTVTDGNGGGNYVVTFVASTAGVITPRLITVTAAANTKTYDATTSAAATPTITTGALASGDTAAFSETYDSKNAGTGKTLTPAGSLTDGNGGNNYLVTFATNTIGVITARALTVTATNNLMKQYDGTTGSTTAPSITSGALQGTDTATFTQSYDTRHVGNQKTVTPAGTVEDGNSGLNYTYTFSTKSNGGITARPITVTAATNSKGYDGTTSAAATPTITTGTLVIGDTATFTETYNNKNVGTNKVLTPAGSVSDGNTGNNYAVTFATNTTGQITARAITVTAAGNSKGYDGTSSAAAMPAITTGTVAGGDTAAFTETYDTRNVGTNKVLTPTGSVSDGNGGNNYAVSFVTNTTGEITARAITVTAATNSKGYDGTTSAAAIPTMTTGTLASGDTAAFAETYDSKNVGTNKVLTPAGSVSDGNGGNNYAVTLATNTTGQITARAITVSAATNSKGYDGTATAAAIPTMTTGTLATGDTAVFTETYDTKNVGTGKTLTPGGSTNDGNGGNNYAVTFVTNMTGEITARAITVTAATNSKGYDGTTGAAAAPAITTGILASGDTAAFTETYDNKNVGTSKVLTPTGSVTDGNGGNNYAVTFATSTTGQITARAITVTAATNSKGYDGTATAVAIPTMTTGTLASGDTTLFTETYDTKNVGTNKVLTPAGSVNDGNGGNNYAVTFATNTTGQIAARAITVTAAANSKGYDGTTSAAATPAITTGGLASGDTAAFTESYDSKNVGTNKVLTPAGSVSDGNAGNNYAVTLATNTTGQITARAITVSAATNSKGYDGTAIAAAIPTMTTGTLATGDTAVFTETYDTKNVGTGKTLTPGGSTNDGNGGNNYAVTFVTNMTGEITARAITVTAATNSKGYDGTTGAAAAPAITTGILASGDTAAFTETYDNKNVGTSKVLTPTGSVTDGNGGNNYAVTFATSTTGQITARAITVTAATNSKGYDGTATAVAIPTMTTGTLASGDTALFTETYDNKNVGTNKVLTPTGSVSDGNGGNNYAVSFVTNTTGEITARVITVTAATNSKGYDGTTSAAAIPTMTTGTLASGDTAAFAETYDGKNVGTNKILTPAGSVSDGNGGNNYAVTLATNTTGQITARAITVSAATNSKGYDGTATAAAIPTMTTGTLASGDTALFTETYDNKNVGTNKVLTPAGSVSDGNTGNNYALTFATNTTGEITARAITVTAATNSKGYDGTASALATPAITAGALAGGDTAGFTETYDSKNVGTDKVLTPAGSVSDGNGGNNYLVTFATNTSGEITARAITITAATNSKGYDGTTSALATPAITTGTLAGGDTAGFTETYDSKNVGTNKVLTPTGSVSDGNAGNNYALTFATNTTGEITARAITVTAATNSKGYDGATSAAATPLITSGTLASGDTAAFAETYDGKNVGTSKVLTPAGSVSDGNAGNNYALTFATNTTGEITARAITVTAATNSKGYDGATSAAATPLITSGTLASGDTAAFTETYDSKNVGTSKVLTPAGSVSDGNGGNNYVVTFASNTTGEIVARAITVTPDAGQHKTYGDSDPALTYAITTGTLVAGDSFSGALARAAGTSVGTYVITQGALTLSTNYLLTVTPSVTFAILARAITVMPDAGQHKTYGESDAALTYTVSGGTLVSGDTFSGGLTRAAGANVGTYLITQGTLALSTNYLLSIVPDVTFEILARAITVTPDTGQHKTYGDSDPALTYTLTTGTLVTGDSFSGTLARSAGNNVGTYAIGQGTLALSTNYVLTAAPGVTFEIVARAITVTAFTNTKYYDGAISAAATPMVTVGTLATTQVGHFTETYDTKYVGSGKTLTAIGTITDATSADVTSNYHITFVTTATGVINAKILTVTGITASNKPYDGNTTAALDTTGAALSGVVAGDIVTLNTTGAVGAFVNASVGSGKIVNINGLTLGGTSAANYALPTPPPQATATASVTAWTLTGFYQPVTMAGATAPPVYNLIKGGQTVPLKFNIYQFAAGPELINVSAAVQQFSLAVIACSDGAPIAEVDALPTTGGTTLRYDGTQFIQNWQSPKAANQCLVVTMKAQDGSMLSAYFKTK